MKKMLHQFIQNLVLVKIKKPRMENYGVMLDAKRFRLLSQRWILNS